MYSPYLRTLLFYRGLPHWQNYTFVHNAVPLQRCYDVESSPVMAVYSHRQCQIYVLEEANIHNMSTCLCPRELFCLGVKDGILFFLIIPTRSALSLWAIILNIVPLGHEQYSSSV